MAAFCEQYDGLSVTIQQEYKCLVHLKICYPRKTLYLEFSILKLIV